MTTKALAVAILDQLDDAQQEKALLYLQSLLQTTNQNYALTQQVPPRPPFPFGVLKGKVKMAENFDDPMEEFEDYM